MVRNQQLTSPRLVILLLQGYLQLRRPDNHLFWECRNRLGIRLQGPRPKFARPDGGEGGSHPSNVHDHVYAIGTINFTGTAASIMHYRKLSYYSNIVPSVIAHHCVNEHTYTKHLQCPSMNCSKRALPNAAQSCECVGQHSFYRLLVPKILLTMAESAASLPGLSRLFGPWSQHVCTLLLVGQCESLHNMIGRIPALAMYCRWPYTEL